MAPENVLVWVTSTFMQGADHFTHALSHAAGHPGSLSSVALSGIALGCGCGWASCFTWGEGVSTAFRDQLASGSVRASGGRVG